MNGFSTPRQRAFRASARANQLVIARARARRPELASVHSRPSRQSYVTLRIPASVVDRVHRRLTVQRRADPGATPGRRRTMRSAGFEDRRVGRGKRRPQGQEATLRWAMVGNDGQRSLDPEFLASKESATYGN